MNKNTPEKIAELFSNVAVELSPNGIPNVIIGQMCILGAAVRTVKKPDTYSTVLNDFLKANNLPSFKMGGVSPPNLAALLPKKASVAVQSINQTNNSQTANQNKKQSSTLQPRSAPEESIQVSVK